MSVSRLLLLLALSLGALVACAPDIGDVATSVASSSKSKSKPKMTLTPEAVLDTLGEDLDKLSAKHEELLKLHRGLAVDYREHIDRYERNLQAGERWGKRVDKDLDAERARSRELESQLAASVQRERETERQYEKFLLDMAGPKADEVRRATNDTNPFDDIRRRRNNR